MRSEYQSRAMEFAVNALRALTYLNGGGLIAIPATVAMFKVDPRQAQIQVLCAARFFIAGLIAALIVQVIGLHGHGTTSRVA